MSLTKKIIDDLGNVHKYINELEKKVSFYNKKVRVLDKEIRMLIMENQAYKDKLRRKGVFND